MRNWFASLALLTALVCAGCGDANGEPELVTAPSTLAPFVGAPQGTIATPVALNGLWGGRLTLSSVTGGTGAVPDAGLRACVGESMAASAGINDSFLVLTRTGATVTGRLTSADTGLAGNYSGTAGETQFGIDASSWEAATLNMICQNGVAARLTLVGSSIVADLPTLASPNTLTGTIAHTFNVELAGAGEGVVTKFTFTMTRR